MSKNTDDTPLPPDIFGLRYSEHRISKIRQVLYHYGAFPRMRSTKTELLHQLLRLRKTITEYEYLEINNWFLERRDDLVPVVQFEGSKRASRANAAKYYYSGEGFWFGRPYLNTFALESNNRYKHLPREDRDERLKRQIRRRFREKIKCDKARERFRKLTGASDGPECSICMEDIDDMENIDEPLPTVTTSCKHIPTVCCYCITQSVDSQIQNGSWDQITCPSCPEVLDYEAVKILASPELFERYLRNSTMSYVRDLPNFMLCLNPECKNGQDHEGGHDYPIMTCNNPTCGFKSCFTHKVQWHEGQTCDQYDEEQRERLEELARQEAASASYFEKETKICPNPSCGVYGTKIDGCDHMTCHRCKYEYCWLCMASYVAINKEGNSAHAENCQYHPDHLPNLEEYEGESDREDDSDNENNSNDEDNSDDEDSDIEVNFAPAIAAAQARAWLYEI